MTSTEVPVVEGRTPTTAWVYEWQTQSEWYQGVEQDGGARLQEVLVHKGGDVDQVVGTLNDRNDGTFLIDFLLQETDGQRRATDTLNGGPIFRRVLRGWEESSTTYIWLRLDLLGDALILDELILQEQKVVNSLELG